MILAVKYTPVAAPGGLRRAVGAFLRYVQYRDQHAEPALEPEERVVDGMLRYVAHRDRAAGRARLFDASGIVGDEERRGLAAFVARASKETRAQLSADESGKLVDHRRAVYRCVISPEHAEGLDLRRLTLAAVSRLESDAGGPVRWIAAEHRNTAHPHVHLIVAGFRETAPDAVRSLVLTKPRLARMKEALALEIEHQRGRELAAASPAVVVRGGAKPPAPSVSPRPRVSPLYPTRTNRLPFGPAARPRATGRRAGNGSIQALLRRVAARYRAEAEREARRAERERSLER